MLSCSVASNSCDSTDCSLPGSSGSWDSPSKNTWASLIAQLVQNPPAMQETPVQLLGREGPLEKRMATHSSILAWRIPWTEESGRLQFMGSRGSDMTEQLNHHHSVNYVSFSLSRVCKRLRLEVL